MEEGRESGGRMDWAWEGVMSSAPTASGRGAVKRSTAYMSGGGQQAKSRETQSMQPNLFIFHTLHLYPLGNTVSPVPEGTEEHLLTSPVGKPAVQAFLGVGNSKFKPSLGQGKT